jgi:hypothetical protein
MYPTVSTASRGFTQIGPNSPDAGDLAIAHNADAAQLDQIHGVVKYSASGAINPIEGQALITKTGAFAAMTLRAPTAGAVSNGGDDGRILTIVSSTAYAHTITTPAGNVLDGSGTPKHVFTFTANAGGSVTLQAQGGYWYVTAMIAGSFTS